MTRYVNSRTLSRSKNIARNPTSSQTVARYSSAQKMYHEALISAGVNPDIINSLYDLILLLRALPCTATPEPLKIL